MAKLVLDTNRLIQSIPQRSRYHVLWQSFVDGKNKLCVSNEILEEYIEILQRLTDNETAEYVVKTILNSPFVELITPFYHFNLITVDLMTISLWIVPFRPMRTTLLLTTIIMMC